jgi:uncharacterized protein (TIGR02466 family)
MFETPMFVTSVFRDVFVDYDVESLAEHIKTLSEKEESKSRSGVNGWQSRFYVDYDCPLTKELFERYIKPMAFNIIENKLRYENKPSYIEYWYNVNKKHSYNLQHTHPRSMLSGAFYIQVPNNSGGIIFNRAETESVPISDFGPTDDGIETARTDSKYWIYPVPREVVMFQGHVPHYVEQNLSEEDRISLSFNVRL